MSRTSKIPGRETRGEWQKRWMAMHKFYDISRNKRAFRVILFAKCGQLICLLPCVVSIQRINNLGPKLGKNLEDVLDAFLPRVSTPFILVPVIPIFGPKRAQNRVFSL